MRHFIKILIFLCAFGISVSTAPVGTANEPPPQMIQALLEREGATLEDLRTDPTLRERMRQRLYKSLNKPAPPRQDHRRLRGRSFVQLPAYCQTIVDHNLFRPLGYREDNWQLKLELVGTMVYADASKNTALLYSNHPKYRRLLVKTGETFLEGLTMGRIEAHQANYTDKAGQPKHLTLPLLFGGNRERTPPKVSHDL